jgi:hypothetical protein
MGHSVPVYSTNLRPVPTVESNQWVYDVCSKAGKTEPNWPDTSASESHPSIMTLRTEPHSKYLLLGIKSGMTDKELLDNSKLCNREQTPADTAGNLLFANSRESWRTT